MSARSVNPYDDAVWFDQAGFALRLGWGPNGLRRLAPNVDAVVVVDVLSFSTAVDIALARDATVFPYSWHDGTEDQFAADNDAVVAAREPAAGSLSLRPSSLLSIPAATRLVLPSPNGSALTFAAHEAGARRVVVACLRNRASVAQALARSGIESCAVIAAGERWRGSTGPLRPAVEDLLGAGAVLSQLRSAGGYAPSPEAEVAIAAFDQACGDLDRRLAECGSGRELRDRGHEADVTLAAELDVSDRVPTLVEIELRHSQ